MTVYDLQDNCRQDWRNLLSFQRNKLQMLITLPYAKNVIFQKASQKRRFD